METEKQCKGPDCPHCQERAIKEAAEEEMQFAILLSTIPLLVVTLFNNMNLF